MNGFLVLGVIGIFFIGLAIITTRVFATNEVDEFIVAGRRLPFGLIAASVMVSWIWTTSLLGAAEAGMLYGIGGGLAFSLGSMVPILVFLPVVLRLRNLMPYGVTFTSFVKLRYGKVVQSILLLFLLLFGLYITVDQVIVVGYSFSISVDFSYTIVVISSSVIITAYIIIFGLRGSIFNYLFQFFIIAGVVFIFIPLILKQYCMDTL